MKKISRGKMSKLFGINKETLRYYSDINLLKPKINRINKYSEYTIEDIFLLSTILRARYIGTSIADIKKIKESGDISIYESFVELQLDKIEKEISKLEEIKLTINKNKECIVRAKKFENKFDFENQRIEYIEKVFYKFDIAQAFESIAKYEEFINISEKQKMFIILDLSKANIFEDVDYLYLESTDENKLIEYLIKLNIKFEKISFKEKVIRENFLGTSFELKIYINRIMKYHNLNIDRNPVIINKELNIPSENGNKYFTEIFIKL
ncbi:MerR family transcriptional regulator [Cetobacterium sp.]|uniref:MerR family transcriptional regulator n=1 Tax=Cetobacterium sp. TaxID=2071632 RepID=UPI003F3BA85E